VAELKVPVTELQTHTRNAAMVLPPKQIIGVLNLGWDKVRVAVPFTE
jgi:hypothetical protein